MWDSKAKQRHRYALFLRLFSAVLLPLGLTYSLLPESLALSRTELETLLNRASSIGRSFTRESIGGVELGATPKSQGLVSALFGSQTKSPTVVLQALLDSERSKLSDPEFLIFASIYLKAAIEASDFYSEELNRSIKLLQSEASSRKFYSSEKRRWLRPVNLALYALISRTNHSVQMTEIKGLELAGAISLIQKEWGSPATLQDRPDPEGTLGLNAEVNRQINLESIAQPMGQTQYEALSDQVKTLASQFTRRLKEPGRSAGSGYFATQLKKLLEPWVNTRRLHASQFIALFGRFFTEVATAGKTNSEVVSCLDVFRKLSWKISLNPQDFAQGILVPLAEFKGDATQMSRRDQETLQSVTDGSAWGSAFEANEPTLDVLLFTRSALKEALRKVVEDFERKLVEGNPALTDREAWKPKLFTGTEAFIESILDRTFLMGRHFPLASSKMKEWFETEVYLPLNQALKLGMKEVELGLSTDLQIELHRCDRALLINPNTHESIYAPSKDNN